MCQQVQQMQQANNTNTKTTKSQSKHNNMKSSYSIARVLKTLFKPVNKQTQPEKIYNSLESLESIDNERNAQIEEQFYEEIGDNSANEKLAVEQEIYVPVRFARTTVGTYFWTTNLQPVASTIMPTVDEDLLQPAYCYSNGPYPYNHFHDRWAQA